MGIRDQRSAIRDQGFVAALLCGLLFQLSPVAGQNQSEEMMRARAQSDLVRYHMMLSAYGAGDEAGGLDALLEWNEGRLDRALAGVNGAKDPFAPWDRRRYGLAMMFHTDAASRISPSLETDAAFSHLRRAAKLLQIGTRFAPDQLRPLAQRWYFTVSRYLRDRNEPYVAVEFLEMARDRLPDDPVVLYESATLAELLATDYALADRGMFRPLHDRFEIDFGAASRRRTGHLNEAVKWLRNASLLDPADELLRVHLGRVHALRFDDGDALRVLGEVLDTSRDDATAYLAALFIGGVRERQVRLDDAVRAYRAAIARFPSGHAAYIGLSEVLQRSGKGDESRAVLHSLLGPGGAPRRDPRWWYLFEPNGIADERLAGLRAEVRR